MSENTNQAVWQLFKNRIKERWVYLSDEVIDARKNDLNNLITYIQNRSEESRQVIQDYVDSLWFEVCVRPSRSAFNQSQINRPL